MLHGHFPRNDSGLTSTSTTERYQRDRGDRRRPYSSRLDRDDSTDYKKVTGPEDGALQLRVSARYANGSKGSVSS